MRALLPLCFFLLGVGLPAVGCAVDAASRDGSPDAGSRAPAASASAPAATSSPADPPAATPVSTDGGLADAGYPKTYRSSLGVCWTEPTCRRALSVAHGGDWTFTGNPYDSNAAIASAYAKGIDAVKIDGRITKDGVVVVAHSSPIEAFESLDCYNRKIEEMTAAEVTQCHRLPSQTETFQRLDDVLAYLRGKLVAQICVKRQADTAGIAAAVLAQNAEDFAFLEISASDLQTIVPSIPGKDKLWYLINTNPSELDTLLGAAKNPRAFMYEFDSTVDVTPLVATRLHPAGIRSFTYEKNVTGVQPVKALFDKGFDVVSTNAAADTVQARSLVNTARSISPP